MDIIYEQPTTINYTGVFNDGIGTNISNEEKTNHFDSLLYIKNKIMDDSKFIEELRSLLSSKFNNDINKLAKCVGRPESDIRDFIDGKKDIPSDFFEDLANCISKKHGDNIQFGDKYIEVNNSGIGYTNNYEGMMKDAQVDIIKKMKLEILELKKSSKEKDEVIKSYEDIIKSKDETIKSKDEVIKSKDEILKSLNKKQV